MHARPEYLLFTEALRHASGQFLWRFMLLQADSHETVTASELVDETTVTRTELLALVRGLEAVDEPADVKLFTSSRYISRGFTRGLAQWRSQRWHWERFGRRVPIRDCDLWQRVDHALDYHTVQCRAWGHPGHEMDQFACETGDIAAPTDDAMPSTFDEPAVLVVPRRDRRSRHNRVAAATRSTLGGLRRQVESLLEPALMPAG